MLVKLGQTNIGSAEESVLKFGRFPGCTRGATHFVRERAQRASPLPTVDRSV